MLRGSAKTEAQEHNTAAAQFSRSSQACSVFTQAIATCTFGQVPTGDSSLLKGDSTAAWESHTSCRAAKFLHEAVPGTQVAPSATGHRLLCGR